jgi:hypothetical protein
MAEDYKAKADYYETKAALVTTPQERARLMKLAADYRALAAYEERQKDKPSE